MEQTKQLKLWLIAGCASILMMTSCTINVHVQERIFKEAALAKGMTATQVGCAWSGKEAAICVVSATQGK